MAAELRRPDLLVSPRDRGVTKPNLVPPDVMSPAGTSSQPMERQPMSEFPRPPPAMPSAKAMLTARNKAAALAQTYMPVTRSELRQMVRHMPQAKITPRVPMQQREAPPPGESSQKPSQTHRPSSAMRSPVIGSAAANARYVVKCYEYYVSQGTDPQVALHAARAHAVGVRVHQPTQQRRVIGSHPPPRRANTVPTTKPEQPEMSEALSKLPPPAGTKPSRPSSAAPTPRPSTAGKERANRGGGGPKDALLAIGYQTIGPIAAGAFTMVTRARHVESGKEVAVKTFLMRTKGGRRPDTEGVKSELSCLAKLRPSAHPHVANLIETHESTYETHAILHLCGGGSLLRHLQSQRHGTGLEEPTVASYVSQIASALAHMHDLGVTHRDVKPGNVVFDDTKRTTVRLVDFGFAKAHRVPPPESADGPAGATVLRKFKTICGTPAYMAPELVRGGMYFGPPVDCWALGVFLFELLHNRSPFRAATIPDLNVCIMKGNHQPFAKFVTGPMKSLIKKALAVDVADRLSAKDIATRAEDIAERAEEAAEAAAPAPADV